MAVITKERKEFIIDMFMHYLSLGMSLNDMILSTNITEAECLQVLKEAVKEYKKTLKYAI